MPRALILGGTGLVGRATAARLPAAGWQVDLSGRDPAHLPPDVAAAGGRFVAADRADTGLLLAAFGDGADLLVDCICFTAEDAGLLPPARSAGSTVMISSKAVYVDDGGNHSNSDTPPSFDGPIRETQATVAPCGGDHATREGYGANKVAAEHVLLESGLPVTVLRPSKIHGPGAIRPREWVFVKRVLDGPRRRVPRAARRRRRPHDGRRQTSPRSSRSPRRSRVGGSSTAPTRTRRARSRSRGRSHGSSTTSGQGCCSTREPTRRSGDIRGTRRTRSCSTRPRP